MFPVLREAVSKLIDPAKLRHIAWSHFESDECGALNDWLQLAPQSQPVCTLVGKLVTVDDFAIRPALGMTADQVLKTGKYQYRFDRSPHIPHGWRGEASCDETDNVFCYSNRRHRFGDGEPITTSDLIDPTRKAMVQLQQGPLEGYMPYTRKTEGVLRSLAELKPETLAVMHGSSYRGQCDRLLTGLAGVIKENFDKA